MNAARRHEGAASHRRAKSYTRFPVNGLDSLWNAKVTDHAATRSRLRALGYRYVVWHKRATLFVGRHVRDTNHGVGGAPSTPATSDPFIRDAFRGESPVHDDDLVTVFRI